MATVVSAIPADTDASGPAGDSNLDLDLGDLSAGLFTGDYDIHLNGARQNSGTTAASNKDVYPGSSLSAGQIRFEKKLKVGDQVTVVDYAE